MKQNLWNAPSIKGQANLKQLVGAAAVSTVVGVVLMSICTLLQANASAFGTWGPVVGAAAALIVQVLTVLNLGKPVVPTPDPVPPPVPDPVSPTKPVIPPGRYVDQV